MLITDEQLLDQIRQGDGKAFDSFFRRWYPALLAYATKFLPFEDAENVVQDVMLRLWKRAAVTDIRGSVSAYLYTAVRNGCLSQRERSRAGQIYHSAVRMSVLESGIYEDSSVPELNALMRATLDSLPREQKRAFEKSRFEGMKYEDIAAAEGVSVKTVEYRISRALKSLRLALADYLP